ncbi:Uncharacterised protein [Mycobacterium tuberculosis]|uniref:Uncharacterized protein n=1 Tax=Mycobacterium tuberculosis TaxID=1773 RepID=A0A0T7LZT0_MYCTX|nr:Uncharacterised protein [Mycobacterium tuberculosis]CFE75814.1 Uncharacterised protein [Mycobacterium tuberculosis]CFR93239.1 Uncharacterised protein [Mycobacterium tuberculosis]CKO32151.1 Uncharacterised protein [Mycobacterium tuberculosis]CKS39709.1 Uncharacterised protein [Mycobacterium tuberculosis]
MSRPVSTMVVQTRMSCSRFQNRCTVVSNRSSGICPCATTTRASGTSSRTRAAAASIELTRLCT